MVNAFLGKVFVGVHPGATIKEQLDYRRMTPEDLALQAGLSEERVADLLEGRAELTPQVASRLETVLGVPAAFWENLETIFRSRLLKVKEEEGKRCRS